MRCVRFGANKANEHEIGGKAIVPSSRCLLEVVEGFVEATDMVRKRRINKILKVASSR